MSIRNKLAIVFSVIALLMTGLVGLFVAGGPVMVTRFSRSLEANDVFNLVRDFRNALNRSQSSLSLYLLVGDPQALSDSRDYSRESRSGLEALLRWPGASEDPAFKNLREDYEAVEMAAARIVKWYESGEKQKAIAYAESDQFPRFEALLERVNTLVKNKRDEAQENFHTFRRIAHRGILVIGVAATVVLLFSLLFLSDLYRSMMKPVESLRQAALAFGQRRWDHRIVVPAKNEIGSLAQALNTMAENLRQLELQTIHMERMSTIGQLAGGVAHELNNPLTGVLGQAQLLLAKTPGDHCDHAQLKKIEQAALRCRRIVRALLDFSRPQEGPFQSVDINGLLLVTLELCEADIKANKIHMRRELDLSAPGVLANAPQLEQVFLNLITNALHAMSGGGTLGLRTGIAQQAPPGVEAAVKARPENRWLDVTVSDTGCGMTPEVLERIFEPFFTTKDIGKGTGLGLAISLGIVRNHGGHLWAESDGPGRGSAFHVYLPLSEAASAKETPLEARAA